MSAAVMALVPFLRSYGPAEIWIATSVWNPNLLSLLTAAGWAAGGAAIVHITASDVGALVIPSGLSTAASLRVNIASGSRVGGSEYATALTAACAVEINNLGIISGAGGDGGAGGYAQVRGNYGDTGWKTSTGGARGRGVRYINGSVTIQDDNYGYSAASVTCQQQDLLPPYTIRTGYATGGSGGNGGDWGQAGTDGSVGSVSGSYADHNLGTAGPGQPPGAAVAGNSNITWIATGTRLGPIT